MKEIFTNQSQINAWLAEIGFTEDDGKWYWSEDTTRASYLTLTHGTKAQYTSSDGTDRSLATGSSSSYTVVEHFALTDGGIVMRFLFTNDSTQVLSTPLQLAIVKKEDDSGFCYFFLATQVYYDDLSGTVNRPSQWAATQLGDTNSIAILVKMWDNVSSFINAHVRFALAVQNVSVAQLYTFECGGKTYISGMYAGNSQIKCGQIVFEIAS